MSYVPFQLHAVVMAGFASLFAPFGGFFASGFKRAFNIKDFGASLTLNFKRSIRRLMNSLCLRSQATQSRVTEG